MYRKINVCIASYLNVFKFVLSMNLIKLKFKFGGDQEQNYISVPHPSTNRARRHLTKLTDLTAVIGRPYTLSVNCRCLTA